LCLRPAHQNDEKFHKIYCFLGSQAKETWFPALIVAPSASPQVKIDTKEEFLIRSFKDGRFYTVSRKDTSKFNKDPSKRSENPSLKDGTLKLDAFFIATK
jgi:hypothetical protein